MGRAVGYRRIAGGRIRCRVYGNGVRATKSYYGYARAREKRFGKGRNRRIRVGPDDGRVDKLGRGEKTSGRPLSVAVARTDSEKERRTFKRLIDTRLRFFNIRFRINRGAS